MVRATGAEEGEVLCVGGVDELEDVGGVGEAGDPAILRADAAAQIGRDLDGEFAAVFAAGDGFAAKAGSGPLAMP